VFVADEEVLRNGEREGIVGAELLDVIGGKNYS